MLSTVGVEIRRCEAVPEALKVQTDVARDKALAEARDTPKFSAGSSGPNRISLNRGFDKCTAGTVQQMQTWWDTSWFHDANIYMAEATAHARSRS